MNRQASSYDFVSAMERHAHGQLPPAQVVQLFQWLIDHDVLLCTALTDQRWRLEARELIAAGWCHERHERRH